MTKTNKLAPENKDQDIVLQLKTILQNESDDVQESLKVLIKILENEEHKEIYGNIKSLIILYNFIDYISKIKSLNISDFKKLVSTLNYRFKAENLDIHLDLDTKIIELITKESNYHISSILVLMYKAQIKQTLHNILLEKQAYHENKSDMPAINLQKELEMKIQNLSMILKKRINN